jgi:hypothetical protein
MPAPNPVRELIRRELLDRSPLGSFQDRIELYEDFKKTPRLAAVLDPSTVDQAALRLYTIANKDFILSDVAGTGSCALNVDGGVRLTTGGTANNGSAIIPLTAINSVAASAWNTIEWEPEHEVHIEFKINLPAITNLEVYCGLCLTNALDLTTDADQAVFSFVPASSANWKANTSIGGTDTAYDTGLAAAASTEYRLGIRISSTRVPRFYINGVKYATGAALTLGVNLLPMLKVKTTATATASADYRAVRCSRLPLAA